MYWLALQGAKWDAAAPTGIAAAQISGTTLHALLLADTHLQSSLINDPERLSRFCDTEGFIIDEFAMLNCKVMELLMELCHEFPLNPSKRLPGALPHFGYRSVLICGDLRQVPPSSMEDAQPFWSSATFQNLFEIFWLREDESTPESPPPQNNTKTNPQLMLISFLISTGFF